MPIRLDKTERWWKVVDYLEDKGGRVQRKQEVLARELNMPARALAHVINRAEELGVIEVLRVTKGFGTGRSPNTYRLLMTGAEWREKGDKIVVEWRELYKKRRRNIVLDVPDPELLPEVEPAEEPPPPEELELLAEVKAEVDALADEEDEDDLDDWL